MLAETSRPSCTANRDLPARAFVNDVGPGLDILVHLVLVLPVQDVLRSLWLPWKERIRDLRRFDGAAIAIAAKISGQIRWVLTTKAPMDRCGI